MKAFFGWLNGRAAFIATRKKLILIVATAVIILIALLAIGIEKEKVGIIGIGLVGNSLIVFAFNWILYPFVLKRFRLVKGFFLMIIASFLVNYGTILFYDWAQQDWLGIELIKEVKEYQGDTEIGKTTSWILKQSNPVVFVFLSIKFDPFITTVYMREGANRFDGMNGNDWFVFLLSMFLGDFCWSLTLFWGISLFEKFWPAWKKICKLRR